MSNGHALLSPSGASRWLACTPSARLEEQFPDRAGVAAEEGTLAHKLAEILIASATNKLSKVETSFAITPVINDKLYSPEMRGYVETYSNYVLEQFEFMKAVTGDAMLFQEVKLDLTDYIENGYGTGDIIIIGDGTIQIIDLKYGKGVRVDAKENKQMMLYALGALKEYDWLYKIDRVQMTIYQPRIDNISTWTIDVATLKQWAENEVKIKAALATAGEGEFVVGDHCQFCKARPVCKAQAGYQLEIARHDFKDAVLLDDTDISDILTRSKSFLSWIKSVNDHALRSAIVDGKKWPGYKLVEGRANRIYKDETEVALKLIGVGLNENQIFTKKILGLTAMAGLLTKKKFDTLLGDLIIKPQGSPTLAPEDDKRPELNSIDAAKADFENEVETE